MAPAQWDMIEPTMKSNYTAIVKHEEPWWIGWIEEVPGVNCRERTRDELMDSLRVTLREALEAAGKDLSGGCLL